MTVIAIVGILVAIALPFYYEIERDDPDDTAAGFVLTATPEAGTSQADDRCGVLAIDQAGRKWHSIGDDAQCQFGETGSPP